MRLAISNIAWDTSEDVQVAQLLNRYKIDAIDIAPGKYFPDVSKVNQKEIVLVKTWWADHGIEITGMQSLLFGTTGLNLFGSSEVQEVMLEHLTGICRIGGGLGANKLVFGSPKNRDRLGLSDQATMDVAISFFRRLGDIAKSNGVIVCLEPNPPCYGANFMTTTAETAHVVKEVNHSSIKMQLDTGAITINRENVASLLKDYSQLIAHIHASEPDLIPIGDGGTDHIGVYTALMQYLPNHLVSIEMLATKDEPHLMSIEKALKSALTSYNL